MHEALQITNIENVKSEKSYNVFSKEVCNSHHYAAKLRTKENLLTQGCLKCTTCYLTQTANCIQLQ